MGSSSIKPKATIGQLKVADALRAKPAKPLLRKQRKIEVPLSELKGLQGQRKKAGKSQQVLQQVLADYVEQENDEKKCDVAVEYSEQVDPIHRILRWGRA